MDNNKEVEMNNNSNDDKKPLSKLEQIKAAAAAQSNQNIAQANIKETKLKVSLIKSNPYQPRRYFDEEKLILLADSIKEHALLQPITVAEINGEYILIAGERRLRAHVIAALEYIDCNLLYNITEDKLRELSLIENLQREDLSIIEEALSYKKLQEEYNKSYRDIAVISGRSKSTIADIINLANFSEECQNLLLQNKANNTSILNLILKCKSEIHLELIKRLIDNNLSLKEAREELLRSSNLTEDNKEKKSLIKKEEYPYELPKILGVGISNQKNKLKIEINTKEFKVEDSKNIERYIKMIVEKINQDKKNG
jgi:ParB family transcriptional regulator, chromosome partitioning protein